MIIKSNCKDCIFAIKDSGIQTGCHLGRLDKLEHEIKNGYAHLNRFCNAKKIIQNSTLENAILDVANEIHTRIDIYIFDSGNLNDLNITLQSINDSYCNIYIISKKVQYSPNTTTIVNLAETNEQIIKYYTNNPYICLIQAGTIWSSLYTTELNKLINTDMKQIILYSANNIQIINSTYLIAQINNGIYIKDSINLVKDTSYAFSSNINS